MHISKAVLKKDISLNMNWGKYLEKMK